MTDKEQHISDIINKLGSLMSEANALMQELKGVREQDVIPTHTTHSPKKDNKKQRTRDSRKVTR